jgi:hypothetical protein
LEVAESELIDRTFLPLLAVAKEAIDEAVPVVHIV